MDSASIDGTAETVRKLSFKHVVLIEQTRRMGKAMGINEALKKSTAEIVVLTDADSFLEKDALRNLVMSFADPCVGTVTGKYLMVGSNQMSKTLSSFLSVFKEGIRRYESDIDSTSYSTGELLAFRRNLLEYIEPGPGDDQFVLLGVREKGYRGVWEGQSLVTERIVTSVRDHIRHKSRTTYGTLKRSARFKNMLFNPEYGLFGCLIFPMYLLRILLLPPICLITEISLALLIPTTIYTVATNEGLTLGIVILLVFILIFRKRTKSVLSILICGLILQIAIFKGIFDFLTDKYSEGFWPKLKSKSIDHRADNSSLVSPFF